MLPDFYTAKLVKIHYRKVHNLEPEMEEMSFGRPEVGAEMGKQSQLH